LKMEKKIILYPLNKKTIDNETLVDDLPSVKLLGKRLSDGREGWFYFSPILGSYHTIIPDWVKKGDEVEFFEETEKGELRSLLFPGIKVASGSVTRLLLEDGNILLFSNIAGVHQTFHLLKPKELEAINEIIIDQVYLEESCPRCGSANVFHNTQSSTERLFSKCLNCKYDWKGKIQSELILVKKQMEQKVINEMERHSSLKEFLLNLPKDDSTPPSTF